MMLKNKNSGVLPTKQFEYLLRSALLSGSDAIEAWKNWNETMPDIDRLDGRSYQLFPLLYRNLERQGIKDQVPSKLKSVYAYHWAKNNTALRHLKSLLEGFNSAGIKTLVLKGAALTPLYYEDVGTRVMGDFDILVPMQDFQKAAAFLKSQDWIAQKNPERFDPRFSHSIAFNASKGVAVKNFEIDLHCHALYEACDPVADGLFWERSLPFIFQGVETRVLCPTDQLLHVCVHGIKKEWGDGHYKWIPDAMMILRHDGEKIEWDRLVRMATTLGVAPMLTIALSYLNKLMDADIPLEVIARLDSAKISNIQRLRCKMDLIDLRTNPIALVKWHWCIYSQGIKEVSLFKRFVRLPEYLKYLVQTNNVFKLSIIFPYRLLKLFCRQIVNRVSQKA